MNKKHLTAVYTHISTRYGLYFVFLLIGITLLFIDQQHSDLGFLQLHSIDEYAFYGSLHHMYDSLITGNLSGLFGYGFYQYGFIYFFIHLVLTLPAFITNHTTLAIIIPRLVTSASALMSLWFIYRFARLTLTRTNATLVMLVFVTMPAFWYNATWFHPDWPMTLFLCAFVYFLARDRGAFTNNFYFAIASYALAVAFKYQAITALPLIGLYIAYPFFKRRMMADFITALKRLLITGLSVVGIFLICNPYIIHPMGWRAFSQAFIGNMFSNATNHGLDVATTIVSKVTFAIGDYYMNVVFLFIVIVASVVVSLHYIRAKTISVESIIAINFLINLGYLFLFVNKNWQTYYLPVFFIGLLSLLHFLPHLPHTLQRRILLCIICIQIGTYAGSYVSLLTTNRQPDAPDYITYSESEIRALYTNIETVLAGETTQESVVLLSAYTPFPYHALGIGYDRVKIIFGALTEDSFDINTYIAGQRRYWGPLKTDAELAQSFKEVDFIVLRKDIPYIDLTNTATALNKAAYEEGARIVTRLYEGQYNYELMFEDDTLVIFKKSNHTS